VRQQLAVQLEQQQLEQPQQPVAQQALESLEEQPVLGEPVLPAAQLVPLRLELRVQRHPSQNR
jgi:hypothetical protein